MKTGTIVIIILLLGLVGLIVYGSFKTGNIIKEEDIFEGVITNLELEEGVYDGVGVYDRTCQPVESGLTQCDGGIQTSEGLINFQYKHDMAMQPCIDSGQKLKVEVLADNRARVTRI